MPQKQKYKVFQLHDENYETAGERMAGEPRRIVTGIAIDFSVFKHSAKEKELLKLAKAECKREEMKR
jgi:cell shape-determining protein MreC